MNPVRHLDCAVRGLRWTLADSEFFALTDSDCFYCGAKPSKTKQLPSGSYTFNGVDRKDNERGYDSDNVLPCCEICNLAKRDLPFGEFVAWLRQAGQHLKDKPCLIALPETL